MPDQDLLKLAQKRRLKVQKQDLKLKRYAEETGDEEEYFGNHFLLIYEDRENKI